MSYDASVLTFIKGLTTLFEILKKGEEYVHRDSNFLSFLGPNIHQPNEERGGDRLAGARRPLNCSRTSSLTLNGRKEMPTPLPNSMTYQDPSGTHHISESRPDLAGRSPLTRCPNGHGQRLECALRLLVVIRPIGAAHMHRHTGRLGKAFPRVCHIFCTQLANRLATEVNVSDQVWTVRQVDDRPGKRRV